MTHDCELKKLTPQPALTIRTRAAVEDLPRVFGEGYGAIFEYLGELNEQPTGPPYAVYYNMDMKDLDIEFGFPVPRPLDGKGDIQPSQTPGGLVATSLHVGPYDACEPAYNALAAYAKERGHEMTGVAYEMYLNDPNEVPPEQIQTQIGFLLKD